MATGIYAYSTTAATNATASSEINFAEGQAPGTVNNSGRQVMADIAEWRNEIGGALTLGGTATAYTLTSSTSPSALADGIRIHAVANITNTGAATLAVDSLGAKKIRKVVAPGATPADGALEAGDILLDQHCVFEWDASADAAAGAWILLNPSQIRKGSAFAISGLIATNNSGDATNDIDVSAGRCVDATGSWVMVLASSITKRLDASWAVGTNQGGLDTGSIANAWYYLWLIMRIDTGVVDVLLSTSSSAPTMPTNYTVKRLIGAMERTGGALRAIGSWEGPGGSRVVRYTDDVQDKSGSDTSATDVTLTTPVYRTLAALLLRCTRTTATCWVKAYEKGQNAPGTADAESSGSAGSGLDGLAAAPKEVWTDASAVIRYLVNNAGTTATIRTRGYTDPRIQ